MKVKICGIHSLADAQAAVAAGADLLGFNFYPPSPRYIAPEECAPLVAAVRRVVPAVVLVGVFVNAGAAQVREIVQGCGLDLAQLSGDESAETLAELGESAFKALRPASEEALAEAVRRYPRRAGAPAWLIDAYRSGAYGGTGQIADWGLARRLAQQAPLLLAGGLKPDNVGAAIRQVRPWGVDVASGVEAAPGVKDAELMRAFVQAARAASQEVEN